MWNVGTSKAKIGGSVMFAEGKQKGELYSN